MSQKCRGNTYVFFFFFFRIHVTKNVLYVRPPQSGVSRDGMYRSLWLVRFTACDGDACKIAPVRFYFWENLVWKCCYCRLSFKEIRVATEATGETHHLL